MTYTTLPMVASDGSIQYPIIIGDDYNYTNGRGFVWSINPIQNYVLSGSTCWFGATYKNNSFLVQGQIALVSTKWELRFSLNQNDTANCDPGWYRYSVEVRYQDIEATSVLSDCTVQLKQKQTIIATLGQEIDGGDAFSLYTQQDFDGGEA